MKTLVFGKLIQAFYTFHHIRTGTLPLGNRDEDKYDHRLSYSSHYPQQQTAHANVMVSLKSVNKLPNTRVFIAGEKWMVSGTGVGGLISLQNGNLRR